MKCKTLRSLSKPEKWIILGIPVLFILGYFMHIIYDLTGQITLVGMLTPVNESLWEHLKMVLLPMIGWWGFYYYINREKYEINKDKWFFALVIALISSILTILAFYYIYTQAFGIELLALDIFDLLLSVAVGQFLGLHMYKYSKGIKVQISIGILLLLVIVFVIFTFSPPHIPLFQDSISGQYGI